MRSPDDRAPRAGAASTVALWLACLVLGALVVLLGLQNRRLKEALAAATAPAPQARPERERLQVGERFEAFDLEGPGGRVAVRFGAREPATLLLVFAERCPACPGAFPAWRALAQDFEAAGARVIALRLDPKGGASSALELPSGTLADARQVPLAKLATVPLTAYLDGDGVVLWARYGPLDEAARAELAGFAGS